MKLSLICTKRTNLKQIPQNYGRHLTGIVHRRTMRNLALKLKTQVQKMRSAQRNAQRDLESKDEDNNEKSQFCMLCRLNYRQPKEVHQASDSHMNMDRFLRPLCSICHGRFKSPMLYETHRGSLHHLKEKANFPDKKTDDEDSELENGAEMDFDNFMTVDSVGDVDDDGC